MRKHTCKAHGEASQEQRLCWVRNHGDPYLWVECVSQHGNDEEDGEEEDVEGKEDVGDDVQPVAVPGEVVEEDGDDACAHVDGEPSV